MAMTIYDISKKADNKNVRGDHYITLVVDIPTKLTNEQKEALAAYDKLLTGEEKHIKKKGFFK